MRFDSAREAGLSEEHIERIRDGYGDVLPEAEAAILELTDALIGMPAPPGEDTIRKLKTHFSDDEIVELALGVGLFLGMSKVLITLGLEPEAMPITVLPTPGSRQQR